MSKWVFAGLFVWALLTRKKRRYIATWYERRDGGPWEYKRKESSWPEHSWLAGLALSDLLPDWHTVEVQGESIERRRGL